MYYFTDRQHLEMRVSLMFQTRPMALLWILCFMGCQGAVSTPPNTQQQTAAISAVVQEVTPAEMEVSPESLSDLKAKAEALFNGIKSSSVTPCLS